MSYLINYAGDTTPVFIESKDALIDVLADTWKTESVRVEVIYKVTFVNGLLLHHEVRPYMQNNILHLADDSNGEFVRTKVDENLPIEALKKNIADAEKFGKRTAEELNLKVINILNGYREETVNMLIKPLGIDYKEIVAAEIKINMFLKTGKAKEVSLDKGNTLSINDRYQ